ncbi:MAG: hypothetical protein WEF86_10075 [Gemmatimonadota bacterium]
MTMRRALIVIGLLALPTCLLAQRPPGRTVGDVTTIGNLIHLELEPGAVVPARPFDLDQRTLRFSPEDVGYRVENVALQWDDQFGTETDSAVTLRNFAFPFSGRRYTSFDVGIGELTFPDERTENRVGFEMERYARMLNVGRSFINMVPGIAAYVKPRLDGETFVKELPDRVVVTWTLSEAPGGIQSFTWEPTVNRIQAVLHDNGIIELSYNDVSARDGIVGVFPLVDAGVADVLRTHAQMDLSDVRPGDGPFLAAFEGFHWSQSPRPQDVACTIIGEYGDRFDFIASYSDFRVDDPEGGTPSTGPRGGDVKGIGRDMGGLDTYCSQGRLQAMFVQPISTAAVQQHERSPDGRMDDYDYAVSQIAHELGHRWAAFASALVDGERIPLGPTHWAAGVHLPAAFPYARPYEADIMGGSTWQENPDGTWTQLDRDFYNPAKGWSWPALYLMGLASPEEMPPFFILRNLQRAGQTDAQDRPIYRGEKIVITIQDVIAAMGPRTPTHDVAQKNFNTAIVVITEPGRQPTDVLLDNARNIAQKWVEYFSTTTGGRGTMTVEPR